MKLYWMKASTSRETVCYAAHEAQRGTVDASRADDPDGAEAPSTVRVLPCVTVSSSGRSSGYGWNEGILVRKAARGR